MAALALTQSGHGHVPARRPGPADSAAPAGQASAAQPAIGQAAPYTVAGCAFTLPSGTPLALRDRAWTVAAVRVQSGGVPLLLQDSTAVCAPNGTRLTVASPGQARVKAS